VVPGEKSFPHPRGGGPKTATFPTNTFLTGGDQTLQTQGRKNCSLWILELITESCRSRGSTGRFWAYIFSVRRRFKVTTRKIHAERTNEPFMREDNQEEEKDQLKQGNITKSERVTLLGKEKSGGSHGGGKKILPENLQYSVVRQ